MLVPAAVDCKWQGFGDPATAVGCSLQFAVCSCRKVEGCGCGW